MPRPTLYLTRPADTMAWIRPDMAIRIIPMGVIVAAVWLFGRPAWLGISLGRPAVQFGVGIPGLVVFFLAATLVQRQMSFRRGSLGVPAGPHDAALQLAFYTLNGPVEEAFFRGLVQGGLTALAGPWLGLPVATAAYVLYHRLAWPSWVDVLATALVGVPTALLFWLLPGPPSLVAVSLIHIGATCGFIGLGPWLLQKLHLLR